jgi:hypothetical protein
MIESQAPVVEMLWEAHDPRHALDGRFGFSDEESAGRWVAAMLDEHWGVRIDSCERIVRSASRGRRSVHAVDGPGYRLARLPRRPSADGRS